VILVSREADGAQGLDQAVQRLNSLDGIKGRAVSFVIDISQIAGIEQLVSRVEETEDRLDILVANAAATWGGPFEPTPDASTLKVLDLNVRSVYNLIRLYVPQSSICSPCRTMSASRLRIIRLFDIRIENYRLHTPCQIAG